MNRFYGNYCVQPMYQQPMYQQPMYQQPMYQQPMYQQPMYQQPKHQQPNGQQSLFSCYSHTHTCPGGDSYTKKCLESTVTKWCDLAGYAHIDNCTSCQD
ncbi:hypothetical protein ACQGRZ_13590 [Bacillus wiedmannii]|uniref:hypothetical protein n=1 Tax=Bacillus wiedmannii TaxID=1890302 RepID=UPI003CF34695